MLPRRCQQVPRVAALVAGIPALVGALFLVAYFASLVRTGLRSRSLNLMILAAV